MTVQEYARKQGYAMALLVAKGENIKVYELISKVQLCLDEDYEHWTVPKIGIPFFLVIDNGKPKVVDMFDMEDEYSKKIKYEPDRSKNYQYGEIQRITEMYKKMVRDK